MKVTVWPAGGQNDAVAQYRLLMPSWSLHEQGADVDCTWRGPTFMWDTDWSDQSEPPPNAKVLGITRAPQTDVIVMQRPAKRWWSDIIPVLQQAGIAVVVDVDDLFSQIAKGHIAKNAYAGARGENFHFEFVNEACRRADLVTVSTPRLLDEYGYGHGVVLPNLVPDYYIGIAGSGRCRVGWSGSLASHPTDLPVVSSAVRDALRDEGWDFHVVGERKGVKKALWLKDEPSETGWVPFYEYAYELSHLAIGIVPLANNEFNKAKSALKMAEMAAVGVPCIGTPTPDNQRLHDLGVGLLAKKPDEWHKHLVSLMRSREYQRDLAGRGREIMATQTYTDHCGRWWEAWLNAGISRMTSRVASRMS